MSEADYLAFERASAQKHEYYNGQVYAMTGAKATHNLIVGNTLAALHRQLRTKPCQVYPSDMRVKISQTGLHTYPDIVVVCGTPMFSDKSQDTLLNPLMIVEVLSASTERYDRGMKFQHYRTLESLTVYLLIAHDHPHLEYFARQEQGLWMLREATELTQTLEIEALGCSLSVADVYEKVVFEGEGSVPS
ncbi:hypothetical protein CJ255_08120 [Candidatus Viridilinea mediisalina]|uniref:Putative restriction endonuclease domain-containing protein n=2 Tax=Candidatus Viridilinea mediisalina TaxID=2024553 RepID=A0A2A6RL09_9CHLR|nr:hypothetical protein CJ255_08120 [Candidatus Viridilinea mediisalina]